MFLPFGAIWATYSTLYDLCGLMTTLCKSEDPSLLDGAQVNRGDKFLSVISVRGETTGEYRLR